MDGVVVDTSRHEQEKPRSVGAPGLRHKKDIRSENLVVQTNAHHVVSDTCASGCAGDGSCESCPRPG
jgi:hypothetical protein